MRKSVIIGCGLLVFIVLGIFLGNQRKEINGNRDVENQYERENIGEEKDEKRLYFPPLENLEKMVQEGDLVISEGMYTLENKELLLKGKLVVNGTGKLFAKNVLLRFEQDYNNKYTFLIGNEAEVELENVYILTNGKWMYVEITEHPTVRIHQYRGYDPNIPWWNTGWNSSVYVRNSLIGISVHGNSKLEIEGSNVFLELLFGNSSGSFRLPQGYVDTFSLEVGNDQGVFEISARNSTIRQWGTTLMRNSHIIFVDSVLTVGMNAGSPWPEFTSPHIKISGLKAKMYGFFELPFDTNSIKLVNTTVTSWYPQVFGGAVLEISDSDLADLQWSGDQAKVIVRNSSLQIAFSKNEVVYEIYDSVIQGDVTATEHSRIYLYSTEVHGNIQEIGDGKVFVNGGEFR